MKNLFSLMLAVLMVCCLAAAEEAHTHKFWVNDPFVVQEGRRIREDGSVFYFVAKQGVCDCGEEELIIFHVPDEDVPEGGFQTCPHEVWVTDGLGADDVEWAQKVAEDVSNFVSATCMLCNEEYLFYEGDPSGLNCDGKNHIFKREEEVLEEGWYPSTAVKGYSWSHNYKVYYRAKCVGCEKMLKCYISGKNEDGSTKKHEECDLKEIASYHRYDANSDAMRNEGNTHVTVYQCTVCGNVSAYENTCNLYNNFLCSEEMKEAWEFYGLDN